jgi:hypothetical protein
MPMANSEYCQAPFPARCFFALGVRVLADFSLSLELSNAADQKEGAPYGKA